MTSSGVRVRVYVERTAWPSELGSQLGDTSHILGASEMDGWERSLWEVIDSDPDRAYEVVHEFVHHEFVTARIRVIRAIPEKDREDAGQDFMLDFLLKDKLSKLRELPRAAGHVSRFLAKCIIFFAVGRLKANQRRALFEGPDDLIDEIRDPEADPIHALLLQDAMKLTEELIAGLPRRCRILFRLLERCGTNRAIAGHWLARVVFGNDVDNKSIGNKMYECRQKLRQALREQGYEQIADLV